DVFVAKYSPTGALVWSRAFGGDRKDSGVAIATDGANVYVAGNFDGAFNVGEANLTSGGFLDFFVVKLKNNRNFIWVRRVGSQNSEHVSGLAVSVVRSIVSIYATGDFGGTVDFDPGPGVHTLTGLSQLADTFILKLDANGNYVWADKIGG